MKGEVYARNFGTSTGQKWLPAVIQEGDWSCFIYGKAA